MQRVEDEIMTKATTGCCEPPVHRPATFTARLTRAFRWLREAYRVSCQRRALLALDAAMLKDQGFEGEPTPDRLSAFLPEAPS